MKNGKIESFKDLNVWKEGYQLVLLAYKLTGNYPTEENIQLLAR